MYSFIAQIFGILGMSMNVISYQAKRQKSIILVQLFGSLFFSINMFMIGGGMGCLLNIIGIFRALTYANKDKIKNINICNYIFYTLYILSYVLLFTAFAKEASIKNLIVEFLPLLAMTATTVGFARADSKSVRISAFFSSPAWLIYDSINFSLGGIICEVLAIISAVSAMLRLDVKRSNTNESSDN